MPHYSCVDTLAGKYQHIHAHWGLAPGGGPVGRVYVPLTLGISLCVHLPLSDISHFSCHSTSRRSRALFLIASCSTESTSLCNCWIISCSRQTFALSLTRKCIGGCEDCTFAAFLEIILNPIIIRSTIFRCTGPSPCSMALCNAIGLQTSAPYKRIEWAAFIRRVLQSVLGLPTLGINCWSANATRSTYLAASVTRLLKDQFLSIHTLR